MRTPSLIALFLAVSATAAATGYWFARREPAMRAVPSELAPAPPLTSERREVPIDASDAAAAATTAPATPRAVRPGSAMAGRNDEAIAALERGEFDLAVALFEECLAAAPEEPVFRSNLAEALVRRAYRQHEAVRPCEPCVKDVERAVELAPARVELVRLVERWRAELETEREFLRDRSVHFELSYDGWRQRLLDAAPDVLAELELHYADLALVFAVSPGERGAPRIPVVLYRREEFARITGLSEWAGGSFDGTIRVPIAEERSLDPALSALLRHELVHAFVRAVAGEKVPAWLNEGLAQWLARDPVAELELARRRLAGKQLLPFERLEQAFASLAEPEIPVAYGQATLAVAYLERHFGREALIATLRGCREGRGAAAAFEEWSHVALRLALEDFAADLARR